MQLAYTYMFRTLLNEVIARAEQARADTSQALALEGPRCRGDEGVEVMRHHAVTTR